MENDISDAPSAGALVRPLWRAAAPGLQPIRLPHAQLQVIFRKRANNCRTLLRLNHRVRRGEARLAAVRPRRGILWVLATL